MAFSKAELSALNEINRKRFTDEQIEEALRYQIDNGCTMKEVAEQYGISTQTLANRRDELLINAGLKTPAKKAKKAKKPDKAS